MAIKQNNSGKWSVQVDRKGIPRVRRTGFASRADAELFEREHLAKHRRAGRRNRETPEACAVYVINIHLPSPPPCR